MLSGESFSFASFRANARSCQCADVGSGGMPADWLPRNPDGLPPADEGWNLKCERELTSAIDATVGAVVVLPTLCVGVPCHAGLGRAGLPERPARSNLRGISERPCGTLRRCRCCRCCLSLRSRRLSGDPWGRRGERPRDSRLTARLRRPHPLRQRGVTGHLIRPQCQLVSRCRIDARPDGLDFRAGRQAREPVRCLHAHRRGEVEGNRDRRRSFRCRRDHSGGCWRRCCWNWDDR